MLGNPQQRKRRRTDGAEDETFGAQSLPVGELPADGQPLDGEQYLALVRNQANLAPNVFVATHNPYLLEQTAISPARSQIETAAIPTDAWRKQFVVQFTNMRQALSNPPTEHIHYQPDRLPRPSNAVGWYIWIHGCAPPEDHQQPGSRNQRSTNGVWKIKEPTGVQLLRLSTEHILGLLEAFPYWIGHRINIPEKTPYGDTPVIQHLHSRWMFALLARLDLRLVSEQISTLRTLARSCIAAVKLSRIRRKALQTRTNLDRSTLRQEDVLRVEAGAWMIITIIASVWGQSDLWSESSVDLTNIS